MEKINIVLCLFIFELTAEFVALKLYKIRFKLLNVLFFQIPKLCANIVCLWLLKKFWLCVSVKFLAINFSVFFLTDSFKPKRFIFLFLTELIFIFSFGGLFRFLSLWLETTYEDLIMQKIPKNHEFCVIICIILYCFAIFKVVKNIDKNKFLREHLANVSLIINGKHISFYGLIDSGNCLVDPLTRKPVIIVSLNSLKKFLSSEEIDLLLRLKCRKIKFDTVSGSGFEIPVFDNKNITLKFKEKIEDVSCVVGIVDKNFDNGKFDCLLHRDFL